MLKLSLKVVYMSFVGFLVVGCASKHASQVSDKKKADAFEKAFLVRAEDKIKEIGARPLSIQVENLRWIEPGEELEVTYSLSYQDGSKGHHPAQISYKAQALYQRKDQSWYPEKIYNTTYQIEFLEPMIITVPESDTK